ncbi:glutamine amidotransferase-related protein [Shewanella surugensis]|uniref:GMP synthase n=1 Tax=Shewanella surugensis TaxID=212020 RepID=A0ABT0LB90_9GAMM|nr:GMP synthase [Shewanella surugensis]MCL1124934.1 GMP synthase [Shewanella surugensis]
MKIGILQCDDVRAYLQDEFGNYPQMFIHLFAALNLSEVPSFVFYRVMDGQYPQHMDDCDGYITTGCRWSVNYDEPWVHAFYMYINQLHVAKKKCIGICFGHQMMAKALGGEVAHSPNGWGVGVMTSQLLQPMPWMARGVDDMSAFALVMSHQDQVIKLPEAAKVLAGSNFCPNGMFQIDTHFLGIQGHPEFSKGYSSALMLVRAKSIGEKRLAQGQLSLNQETDELWIGQSMINFLLS